MGLFQAYSLGGQASYASVNALISKLKCGWATSPVNLGDVKPLFLEDENLVGIAF